MATSPPPDPRLIPGAAVLVATAVDAVRCDPGLSPWTPIGLLVGVALIGSGIWRRPGTAALSPTRVILLVGAVLGAVLWLAHLDVSLVGWGQVPGYLGAMALPMLVAATAIGVAALAALRAGATVASGFCCLFAALAALSVAGTAGDRWRDLNPPPRAGFLEPAVVYSVYNTVEPTLTVTLGPGVQTAALIVVGVTLGVTGYWWAQRGHGSILRRST